MRVDSSLHTALYAQGCLRYPGPKTVHVHLQGFTGNASRSEKLISDNYDSEDGTMVEVSMYVISNKPCFLGQRVSGCPHAHRR